MLLQYVSDYKDVFTSDGKVLFCQVYGKFVVIQQCFQVTQHVSGSKHIASVVRLKVRPGRQSLICESLLLQVFIQDLPNMPLLRHLCKAFVSADVPLFTTNNPKVRNFLLKSTQTGPSDESTLRKTIYLSAMKKH
jgi:hypothetical protein